MTARKLQEPTMRKFSQTRTKKTIDVLVQNLGGKRFAFWELNGEIYYQACFMPLVKQ